MLFLTIPSPYVIAEQTESEVDNTLTTFDGLFKYQFINEDTEVEIVSYLGTDTAVFIPNSVNNKPVTSINFSDFIKDVTINSILIPTSVTQIGNSFVDNNTVIYGRKGSYVEEYCQSNDYIFYDYIDYLTGSINDIKPGSLKKSDLDYIQSLKDLYDKLTANDHQLIYNSDLLKDYYTDVYYLNYYPEYQENYSDFKIKIKMPAGTLASDAEVILDELSPTPKEKSEVKNKFGDNSEIIAVLKMTIDENPENELPPIIYGDKSEFILSYKLGDEYSEDDDLIAILITGEHYYKIKLTVEDGYVVCSDDFIYKALGWIDRLAIIKLVEDTPVGSSQPVIEESQSENPPNYQLWILSGTIMTVLLVFTVLAIMKKHKER